MKRTKIIKKNRKSQFMLIAIMLFSLAYLIFGLLMFFSPLINYVDNNGQSIFILLRNFFTNELNYNTFNTFLTELAPDLEWSYNSWLPFIVSSSDTNKIAFLPSQITLIWIPLIVGGTSFFVILTRYIIHIIGYKSINKAGTVKIIRPIRSYQLTLTLTWFFFVILSITAFLTYISSSIFWIGGFFSINYGEGQLVLIVGNTNSEFHNFEAFLTETGVHNGFYWLSMLLFNNWFNTHGQYYVDISTVPSTNDSVSYFIMTLWFLLPALPILLFWINSFIGSIVGSCSWGTINSIVLEAINFKEATDDTSENKQNSDNKNKKNKKEDSHKEREKYLKFYKNLKLMLELSETTWSPLYIKANEKLDKLNSNDEIMKINWQDEMHIIDEILADFFEKDKKFILLLEKIIESSQTVITNSQKKAFKKLIENYNIYYKEQKIIEMETTIEEIYLNSFEFEELYGKIGYCIKNKLTKNFNKINDELKVIEQLNFAKDNEDYNEYRGVCLEAIIKISPNKQKISSLIRGTFG